MKKYRRWCFIKNNEDEKEEGKKRIDIYSTCI